MTRYVAELACGNSALTRSDNSVTTFASGAYEDGTTTSTFALRPTVVKITPFVSFSLNQSTPLMVMSWLVALRAAGVGTPHRNVMNSGPHAAVVGDFGVVFARRAPSRVTGNAPTNELHARVVASSVDAGSSCTLCAHPTRKNVPANTTNHFTHARMPYV